MPALFDKGRPTQPKHYAFDAVLDSKDSNRKMYEASCVGNVD